jgi:dolichol-phosphate mannosyltransferase
LDRVLTGIEWEVIFVDDNSSDGTADEITELARQDWRIRIIRRFSRRGLSSAVIEGALASTSPVIAVIDADLQHDESRLPALFEAVANGGADLAVATRFADGGSIGRWDRRRSRMSRFATRLADLVLKSRVTDPMSGFFAINRDALLAAAPHLSSVGYKVLLDLIASSSAPLRVAEVGYTFRDRLHGESKLDSAVLLDYGELLLDKLIGRWIPVKLIMFGAIGMLGIFVHLSLLALALASSLSFAVSQAVAVIGAMTFNFSLNNIFTHRDRRLTGTHWLTGLLTFYLVCSLGAVGNVGVGSLVYEQISTWWLAGLAGAVVGSVWNYVASSWLTWTRR